MVEAATRLRFRGIREGSLIADLELPDTDAATDTLGLDDRRLGEAAVETTLDVAEDRLDAAGDVPAALRSLADELSIGVRFDRIVFELERRGRTRTVILDPAGRDRLARMVEREHAHRGDEIVVGTLFEADFEKRTAQLRTPDSRLVRVEFSEELADDIQEALRQQARFEGRVTYDKRTSTVLSVGLYRIVRSEQLVMGGERVDFWRNQSLADLQQEQGVAPVTSVTVLRDEEATQEEIEAFLAALRR